MGDDDGKALEPRKVLVQWMTESSRYEPSAVELKQLALAYSHPFGEPVTAFLTRVQIISASCVGVTHRHVKADSRGQFQDGHRIRTSDIGSVFSVGPFWCVRTVSESLYVLVTFHEEGGKASLDEFLHLHDAGIHATPHRHH
jgi:hypothetical protein